MRGQVVAEQTTADFHEVIPPPSSHSLEPTRIPVSGSAADGRTRHKLPQNMVQNSRPDFSVAFRGSCLQRNRRAKPDTETETRDVPRQRAPRATVSPFHFTEDAPPAPVGRAGHHARRCGQRTGATSSVSPSSARVTCTVSPSTMVPARSSFANLSPMACWIRRRSGRAP